MEWYSFMNRETVYIKMEQNIKVTNRKVHLEDIAKVYSVDSNLIDQINKILIYHYQDQKDTKYCFSILKVIEKIQKEHPSIQIINLGETDFILEFRIQKKPQNNLLEYSKAILVGFTVFFGAMFSIMTFNYDASVEDVFSQIYELVLGHPNEEIRIIEIAYSIGLPIGIIVFFNHFSKMKIHDDPTPLQIEMRNYEEQVNKALLQDASREKKTIDIN